MMTFASLQCDPGAYHIEFWTALRFTIKAKRPGQENLFPECMLGLSSPVQTVSDWKGNSFCDQNQVNHRGASHASA